MSIDAPTRPTQVEPATGASEGAEPGPFGQPLHRKEDQRLAAGKGRYLDDLGHDALAAALRFQESKAPGAFTVRPRWDLAA